MYYFAVRFPLVPVYIRGGGAEIRESPKRCLNIIPDVIIRSLSYMKNEILSRAYRYHRHERNIFEISEYHHFDNPSIPPQKTPA
jgi:hypothetical protein